MPNLNTIDKNYRLQCIRNTSPKIDFKNILHFTVCRDLCCNLHTIGNRYEHTLSNIESEVQVTLRFKVTLTLT